jgi:hypothetical protein
MAQTIYVQSVNPTISVDAQEYTIDVEGAVISMCADGATKTILYNEVSPIKIISIDSSGALNTISVRVVSAWDGTGASLTIGVSGDQTKYFASSELDLTCSDCVFEKDFDEAGPLEIYAYFAPGAGASAGQVRIQTTTTKEGV